jgi:hypothetical protein
VGSDKFLRSAVLTGTPQDGQFRGVEGDVVSRTVGGTSTTAGRAEAEYVI